MRDFPAFLIKKLTGVLACEFGVDSHELMYNSISRYTGTGAWFYSNTPHALEVMKLLGRTHYREQNELRDFVIPFQTNDSLSCGFPSLLSLVIAEYRNAEVLFDFVTKLALRFSIFFPSEKVWSETTQNGLRICHDHCHKELSDCGPQSQFAIIASEARSIFNLSPDDILVNFSRSGIRDENGFFKITGVRPRYHGKHSYIQFNGNPHSIRNPHFNKYVTPLIQQTIRQHIDQSHGKRRSGSTTEQILAIFDASLHEISEMPDLEQIASRLGLSRASLYRRLLEEGSSFSKVQDAFRLEKSKQMLLASRDNVSQISDRLGFSCLSSFSRFFKTHAGVSPLVFRSASAQQSGSVLGR